ncbi:MAG TPA: sigma-70 family RNA polymerase sigma factor [Candidatus Limnocylindrales bacterium]|nr:sigma-70 family RNA polymerase sigma factor [Candidatus Limnocylindrales bacterium]
MADSSLVVAAQLGDGRAREELIAAYLPLLYNIVRRALGPHADVDDVVQETLLRVVRDLPALRDPNSFRSWLVAIAIRQIGSYRERQRAAGGRVVVVAEADELPDSGFEDLTILRLHVSGQRREVAEASRWLDPEHRLLLSLWWQESAGWLSRGDLAAAMGLSVAHAAVRLQRMREQLEQCREVVAALDAEPRCGKLAATVGGWGGDPNPLWRKRVARHVRGCRLCLVASEGQVPLERLLLTFLPLTVPVGLAATLAAKGLLPGAAAGAAGVASLGGVATGMTTGGLAMGAATGMTTGLAGGAATAAGAGAGAAGAASAGGGMATGMTTGMAAGAVAGGVPTSMIGKLAQAMIGNPVASLATGAAVVVFGSAVTMVTWPESPAETPAVIAAPPTPNVVPNPAVVPSATTPPPPAPRPAAIPVATPPSPVSTPSGAPGVPLGAWSLESVAVPRQYVTYVGDFAALQQVSATSGEQVKRQATLTVVKGLADPNCVTFRASDGRYLRHMMMRLRLSNDEGTQLFREDATFCPSPGAVPGSVSLESYNYRPQVVRYRAGAFYVNLPDGSKGFGAESSFITRDPWIV